MQNPESEIEEELLSLFKRTGRATGYWPRYFLRSLRRHGGLAVARKLLQPGPVGDGFNRLIEVHRVNLSVEAIAISDRYAGLFTKAELDEAQRRLDQVSKTAWPKRSETSFPDEVDPDTEFDEGSVQKVLVNRYERDPKARTKCIAYHGARCKVCDMDFEERYGQIGEGFIHVHHIRPLSGPGAKRRIDPKKDLVPVCPNCHAMLHRTDPPMDIKDLRRLISTRQKK